METRVPILMYHKIAPVDPRSLVKGHYVAPGMFARHMRLLKLLRFESVSISRLFEDKPQRPIGITFDDGYQNFYDHALPILKKSGYVSTVYLVANQLGGSNEWDAKLGDVTESLMSVETIRSAALLGTEFGSHTLDHVDLKEASEEEAQKQIRDSKTLLERELDLPIETFCYPYGKMNANTPAYVKEAGYGFACSTLKGANTDRTDRYALRRINVRSDTWTPVLWLKLLRSARNGN